MSEDPASLENLHDIVETVPVTLWWPLAPGWCVIVALLLLAVVIASFRCVVKRHRNAYRRWALKELDAAEDARQLPTLLKRVALVAYPREQVGALAGSSWLDFLNQEVPNCFDVDAASLLLELDYLPNVKATAEQLKALRCAIRRWTLEHSVKGARA